MHSHVDFSIHRQIFPLTMIFLEMPTVSGIVNSIMFYNDYYTIMNTDDIFKKFFGGKKTIYNEN
jgi:ABC-type uncharacterized transport system permease subunit